MIINPAADLDKVLRGPEAAATQRHPMLKVCRAGEACSGSRCPREYVLTQGSQEAGDSGSVGAGNGAMATAAAADRGRCRDLLGAHHVARCPRRQHRGPASIYWRQLRWFQERTCIDLEAVRERKMWRCDQKAKRMGGRAALQ